MEGSGEVSWEDGTLALKGLPHKTDKPRNVPLHAKFDTTNWGLKMSDVEKERSLLGKGTVLFTIHLYYMV